MRWQSHVFNSNVVFTRPLLDEIYHLPGLPFEWLNDDPMFISLLHDLILGFCFITLIQKTSGFELTSTKMLSWYKHFDHHCFLGLCPKPDFQHTFCMTHKLQTLPYNYWPTEKLICSTEGIWSHFYWQVINLCSAKGQPYVLYRVLYTDTLWHITIWFPSSINVTQAADPWFCYRHFLIQFILKCSTWFCVQMFQEGILRQLLNFLGGLSE